MSGTKRTNAEWLEIVKEQRASGETAKAWCAANKISYYTFVDRVARLRKEGKITEPKPGRGVSMPKQSQYRNGNQNDTDEFLSIEELSRPVRQKQQPSLNINNDAVLNLIVDRFYELNRFINLLNREQKIVINLTAAKAEGYKVEYV